MEKNSHKYKNMRSQNTEKKKKEHIKKLSFIINQHSAKFKDTQFNKHHIHKNFKFQSS